MAWWETAPGIPALSVEADSESLFPLLRAVAAAYVLGASVRVTELFRGRYVKSLPLDKEFLLRAEPALVEQLAVGVEAVQDALGVVKPVDAQ